MIGRTKSAECGMERKDKRKGGNEEESNENIMEK